MANIEDVFTIVTLKPQDLTLLKIKGRTECVNQRESVETLLFF